MKSVIYTSAVFFAATMVSARPLERRQANPDQISALAPDLGHFPNAEPIDAECLGPVQPDGSKKRIPCICPPTRDEYVGQLIANVQNGFAIRNPGIRVDFPTDDSIGAKKARITAGIITLQNLRGPGVGCPGVSTTFANQLQALDAGQNVPPPPPPPPPPAAPAPAPAPNNGVLTRELVAQLAPDLGSFPNRNPTGTGDCDGPPLNGNVAKVPCACPPVRDDFINALFRDAQLGHAFNNPPIGVNFPLGDSIGDKKARITASIIALQNLRGPGVGCPGVSTTLSLQAAALDAGQDVPPAAPAPAPAPAPPAPAPAPPSGGGLTRDLVARLAPNLGAVPNQEPIDAECLGPVQQDGTKKRIPCICPPDVNSFVDALTRDAQLGFCQNNPGVRINFPTDDSRDSQRARLQASVIVLQNLRGPGVGCPAVATTLLAQIAALA